MGYRKDYTLPGIRRQGRGIGCVSEMLRLEEDYVIGCGPNFVQLLALLESGKPPQELQAALSSIPFE